jgi:UDPglucose--hexose-1-phosphate uridylyltransferase
MAELRYNPLQDTWVMHAPNRQGRPHLPADWCPFCPSSGLVPADFTVLKYDNDYPVLSTTPENIERIISDTYLNAKAYGKCEVILYTKNHNQKFYELEQNHLVELIQLWQDRYSELCKDEKIQYIHIFENKGEEVGVTIHHAHGQIYAHSWVPPKIENELINSKLFFEENDKVLLDEITKEELNYGKRIITQNDSFIAYIPYFSDYPYGVFIATKKHHGSILDFTSDDKSNLASILKDITYAFDQIFDKPFPYMMSMHQTPINTIEYDDASDYYRFHIQFYTPLRAKDKIKWYAGSEMGAGVAANPLDVDECASVLRKILEK